MKNMFARLALAAALGSLLISIQPLLAQGTAFTYQGQLSASGSPANGNYDFQFSLFNAATAGSQVGSTITQTAIGVTNGMFMATIDFGPGIFTGPNYWLAINVRSNNVGSYTALTPLQALTPTPYAIYTPNAGSAATATSATTATTAGNFTGPLVGNVTGTQGATVVSSVGSAALPGAQLTGTVPSSALNGVNGSGLMSLTAANIAAGTAGISVSGNAAGFTGTLSGDVTGAQGATAVSLVGGQTAANVASGASAANALLTTNVDFSFFAGQSAGNGTTSASDNTGLGYQALHKNTVGGSDTATGYEALYNNVGGSENTAFGAIALVDMTSGAFNTAIGYNSLPADTADDFNTALGANTLVSHTSGNNNTAIGYQALLAHSSGTNNIALGNQAGENLSTGSGNIYIGSIGGAAGGTENNIIRIGTNQTTAYIAGAITGNGGGLTNLNITVAELPIAVVTNNEPTVAFSNLTLTGSLTLPASAANGSGVITLGGSVILSASYGLDNFFAGQSAGNLTTANQGQGNTGIGAGTFADLANGMENTAVGVSAMTADTTGQYNTAIGAFALHANTIGSDNTASGFQALINNTTNSYNTADGFQALYNNQTGGNNIALGYQAGLNLTTGSSNIYIGSIGGAANESATIRIGSNQTTAYIAGAITGNGGGLTNLNITVAELPIAVVTNNETGVTLSNLSITGILNLPDTGPAYAAIYTGSTPIFRYDGNDNNLFVGFGAGNLTAGGQNTAFGNDALNQVGSVSYNTAIGYAALEQDTTGGNNTAVGNQALFSNTSGGENTAIGYDALANNNGSDNTASGYDALLNNTTGANNTAIGFNALLNNTTGQDNTASGYAALLQNTLGSYNTASGYQALYLNKTGSNNTASGYEALENNSSGSNNMASGYQALFDNTTGSSNVADGLGALQLNGTGNNNTAVGGGALLNLGYNGGGPHNGGTNNIALGYQAGSAYTANESSNIDIGSAGVATENNTIHIGNGQTSAFMAGISGVSPTGTVLPVVINANGQLGTGSGGGSGGSGVSSLTSSTGDITVSSSTGAVTLGVNQSPTFSGTVTATSFQSDADGDFVVGAADGNTASGGEATVGGGADNSASGFGSVVAGGGASQDSGPNTASAPFSVVSGGAGNTASGLGMIGASTVGGGYNNTANADYATVPGGENNTASGTYSFAAGQQAQAQHQGAFVWADSQNAAFSSTANDQFNVRAQGGVRFVTGGAGMTIDGQPVLTGTGGGGALTASSLTLPATDVSSDLIYSGNTGTLLMDADNNGNFFIGQDSGNLETTGSDNTAIGTYALENNTTGNNNTANGEGALYANTSGSNNTATGFRALLRNMSGQNNTANGFWALVLNTGSNNTAIGAQALGNLGLFPTAEPGGNNIALGIYAGNNYTGSESSNIDIGNVGVAGDNNTIRIGDPAVHSNTFIAGVITGNGSGLTNLSAAQLTGSSEVAPPANGYPILNMVYIVPGTFVMGAPTSDPDYASDETQHVVTLTNGFWMGQHPVTQGEYLAVVGNNPSAFTGDLSRPVESVTWFNAGTFCTNLTQNEQSAGRLPSGWVYRLPTESEWEYCCRALTTSRYYFGNDPGDGTSLTNYAWYSVNSGNTTQPVGQLLPNAWGLVDMAGNVFEWCQDWYGTYPTANVSYNPRGPATGSYRVLRGGGWDIPAIYCRSANRYNDDPTGKPRNFGFRVVLAPGP